MAINAQAPGKIKGTSITTPTASQDNHTLVLGQLKETVEIAQRLRGDPNDSFVRVSEINSALGTRLVNNTLQPPSTASSSAVSISVTDSITGAGTVASPLQLSGDSASPGNNMVYGTNGSGVKGWYAAGGGGGSGITVTDGTHTVTGATTVTFSGATVGGTSPNATVTVSGGGGALPSALNIPNLQFWFDASQINANAGSYVPVLQNLNPPFAVMTPAWSTLNIGSVSSTQLNSKNVLNVTASGASGYTFPSNVAPLLAVCTVFVVFNTTSTTTDQSLISGGSNSFSLQIAGSGNNALNLSNSFVANSPAGSAVLSPNTWFQVNATWNQPSGAYAFRVAQTAAGSGSWSSGTMNGISNAIGWTSGYGQSFVGQIAEIIEFDRVLSSGEITAIESYLHTKWGV